MTTTHLQHTIGGHHHGTPVRERRNPADSADVVSVAAQADSDTVAKAVEAAAAARSKWAGTPAPTRGRILLDAADLLARRLATVARDLVREEGKTLGEATAEAQRAVDLLRYHGAASWRASGEVLPAAQPSTLTYTIRHPVGVVVLITPWNFPLAIPAWKLAPALVCGNTVVLKPSELTPLSAHHLTAVLQQAGLPAGVLNLVHGDGTAGAALASHPDVNAVSFTGSVPVGTEVRTAAERHGARVQLEMGGKNPLVVLKDADTQAAARIAAIGGFGLTGQACTASSRVIVEADVHDRFIAELAEQARSYQPGNGLIDGVRMGPVVSETQLESDLRYLRLAQQQGAGLATGETRVHNLALAPSVVVGAQPDSVVARDELFAPMVVVLAARDLDEAIHLANDSPYGLAAGIITNDQRSAHEFATRVNAGVVKVNQPTTGLDLNVPFGGVKASSNNTFREQGSHATDFYSWEKSIYLGWAGI